MRIGSNLDKAPINVCIARIVIKVLQTMDLTYDIRDSWWNVLFYKERNSFYVSWSQFLQDILLVYIGLRLVFMLNAVLRYSPYIYGSISDDGFGFRSSWYSVERILSVQNLKSILRINQTD